MAKRSPKQPARSIGEPLPLSKQANEAAESGIAGIIECIKQLRSMLAVEYNADLASELGILTHKAAQIMDSARKREKDEAKADLTDAQLVDYFRKMTTERREQWVRDIQAMSRKGSVLG